jgi:hypothetical protein
MSDSGSDLGTDDWMKLNRLLRTPGLALPELLQNALEPFLSQDVIGIVKQYATYYDDSSDSEDERDFRDFSFFD